MPLCENYNLIPIFSESWQMFRERSWERLREKGKKKREKSEAIEHYYFAH
jgi:hypothetical protein